MILERPDTACVGPNVLLFMVRFSVAVLSQPDGFVVTKVYVPLVVYAVPFQVYSSHSVTSVVIVGSSLVFRETVIVMSQATALSNT